MSWEPEPIPGGWVFTNPEHKATIKIDYLTPIGRGLEGWVECTVDGRDNPLAWGRQDLTLASAVDAFARQLRTDAESEIPWTTGLRDAYYFAIAADRDGGATVDLATVDPKGLLFVLDPIVENGGNTRLIAQGGAGKSLFAMASGLTVSTGSAEFLGLKPAVTGPVLYLDWETNADTHAQRIKALCAPAGVPFTRDLIYYRREDAPLARSVQAVVREAKACEAVMLIVDSLLMAAGPSGQSSGEESTGNLFIALRQIGIPALVVDHKSAESIRKNTTGGYGSIYKENLSRMQWEFTHYSRTATTKRFVLTLTKENNVGEVPPLGFTLTTEGGKGGITSAVFAQADPESIMSQSDDQDLGNRLYTLLSSSNEPVDADKLVDMLGGDVKRNTVTARLKRDGRFTNVSGKGKPGRYRLSDELLRAPRDDGFQGELEPPPEEDGLTDSLDAPVSDFRAGEDVF